MPAQITLVEPLDNEKIKFILDNFDHVSWALDFNLVQIKTQQEPLVKLLHRESATVTYLKQIRMVAQSPCFLNVKREFRTFCTNHMFHDIDAESSHYNIFKWFSEQLDIPITKFKSLKKVLAKQDAYSILNGGDTLGFDDCADEINKVVERLKLNYPVFLAELDLDDRNLNGKYISRFMNAIEMALVDIMMKFFEKHNFKIRGLFYDGFFINRTDEREEIFQAIFDEFEQHVLKEYHIQYSFKIKEHQDVIKEKVIPLVVQENPTIRTERYVNFNDIEYPSPAIVIQANLGTGKSTSIDTFLEKNGHDYQSVVVLTPRVTYASSVLKMFKRRRPDMILYTETKSRKISKPDIIIQFESLFKLNIESYIGKSILLICDECEALCTQITSFTTNKKNHYRNIQSFEVLVKGAKKIIATDAFASYSKKMLRVLRDMGIQYQYFKYDYNYINRFYYQVSDSNKFTSCLFEACKLGQNSFVFCSSKYRADIIRSALKGHFPELKIAAYMKDEKTTPLIDVNHEWAQFQVVICTSSITIGLDCNIEHFDNLFVYASTKSKNLCRDIMQATYRPRKIKNGLILCIEENDPSIKNCSYRVDLDFQEKKFTTIKAQYNTIIRTNNLDALSFCNNRWLMDLFIHNSYEHIRDVHFLNERLNDLLSYCGYTKVTDDMGIPDFFLPYFQVVKKIEEEEFLIQSGMIGPSTFTVDEHVDEQDVIDQLKDLFEPDGHPKPTAPEGEGSPCIMEYNYFEIKNLSKDEYRTKCKLLTKTREDLLELDKYRFKMYCKGYLDTKEENETLLAEYFPFFEDERTKSNFFRIRLEKKMNSNEPFLTEYIRNTPYELRHPRYMATTVCTNIYNKLGLWNSYEAFDVEIDPKRIENVFEYYKSKKEYINLTELLGIPVNKNLCLTQISTCVTMLNHIFRRYTYGIIQTTTKRVQINKTRIRETTYMYVKDPDKHFDADLIVIHSIKK